MALTPEDLQALAGLIDQKVSEAVSGQVADAVTAATTPQPSTNDEPQNQPENQPVYYVHLANGKVVETRDSVSTHMTDPDTGEGLQVIGRYAKGE